MFFKKRVRVPPFFFRKRVRIPMAPKQKAAESSATAAARGKKSANPEETIGEMWEAGVFDKTVDADHVNLVCFFLS